MKKYIYTGEYFHQTKEDYSSNDVKIGLTKDFVQRERELTGTNGPIKYQMTSVWEISIENVENPAFIIEGICHSFFHLFRYDGNEWFNTELVGKSTFYTCLSRGLSSLNRIPGVKVIKLEYVTGEIVDETVENRRRLVTKLGNSKGDSRIVELCSQLEVEELVLSRKYKGREIQVTVKSNGMYYYLGEEFDTHNKMYNNGIVLDVRGVKGGSGNSSLKPYTIVKTGQKISEIINLN